MDTENNIKPDPPQKRMKKKKPLQRASNWGRGALKMAGKLLILLGSTMVLGVVFSALQGVEGVALRISLSLVILVGMMLLYAFEGMTIGTKDALNSYYYNYNEAGGTVKIETCYQPKKALCAVSLVFIVPMILACIVAKNAREYTYVMQDLPVWMTQAYGARDDVMAPLGAYTMQSGLNGMDVVRILVRLPLMIWVNLFPDPLAMSGWIDVGSPLMMACFPLMVMLGYMMGPYRQRRIIKENRRSKKVAVRKVQKHSLAQELTGVQGQVHYGHRRESDAPKRKDLI